MHSRHDAWLGSRVVRALNEAGAECLVHEWNSPSDDLEEPVLRLIGGCAEVVALVTPWSLEGPYLWVALGAAWGLRKQIVALLHGVSEEDLSSRRSTPVSLSGIELLEINDLKMYLKHVRHRSAGEA